MAEASAGDGSVREREMAGRKLGTEIPTPAPTVLSFRMTFDHTWSVACHCKEDRDAVRSGGAMATACCNDTGMGLTR